MPWRGATYRAFSVVVGGLLLCSLMIAPRPAASQSLPIPGLPLWQTNMLSYGQARCSFLAQPNTFANLLDNVYYDSERVFYQIADYTADPSWTTCAQLAESIYRDQYVIPNNGSVPGYWNFTTGLRMDYQRTGDTQSQNAAVLLSQNMFAADSTPLSWTVSADYSREVAYA